MSVLDRIVDATRDERRHRRRERCPLARARAAAVAAAARSRAVPEALAAAGHLGDRRAQAPLAVGGRDPRATRRWPRSSAPTSAAARRRCRSSPRRAHFGGSLDDLRAARAATRLPILRKDFIVDPYQVYESAVAGADAILLIVAALDAERPARACTARRSALDLDVLVEVHDEDELEGALEVDADVIGINNRDLGDFTVDIERTYELLVRRPGRQDGRLGVGLPHARAARRARARGRRRGADRRGPDARGRRRGRRAAPDGRRGRGALGPDLRGQGHPAGSIEAAMRSARMLDRGDRRSGATALVLLGVGASRAERRRPRSSQPVLADARRARPRRRRRPHRGRHLQARRARGRLRPLARSSSARSRRFDLGRLGAARRGHRLGLRRSTTSGTILTNAHVVHGATEVTRPVRRQAAPSTPRRSARTTSADLALLAVDPKGLELAAADARLVERRAGRRPDDRHRQPLRGLDAR